MKKYFKQFNQQTEYFSKLDPISLFLHVVEMLKQNYKDEIEELNLNDRKYCKKEEFKLKFRMSGHSNTKTDWVFDIAI